MLAYDTVSIETQGLVKCMEIVELDKNIRVYVTLENGTPVTLGFENMEDTELIEVPVDDSLRTLIKNIAQ